MDRINRILHHPLFKECIRLNEMAEADRCFCHHDIEHLCAVARIAMLLNIEEKAGISKDIVYAAALLHDSGRYRQYLENIPHEKAGVEHALIILPECGYTETETGQITEAISLHRDGGVKEEEGSLTALLYRADKLSRNCAFCKMYEACNWPEEKKGQAFYL